MKPLLKSVESALYDLIQASSTSVPKDVIHQLETFRREEKNSPIIEAQLGLMLDNIEYGQAHGIPLCQDTGHINLFIQIGENFPHIFNFSGMAQRVLTRLTKEAILRPNTVDPFTQNNMGDNSGANSPPIYLEIVPNSSDLVITVLNKGGGSENMSQLLMLSPASGLHDLVPRIVEIMREAGGKP
ncbi:MAG: fumarate hydratase, partial [Promethearchaeota archaeon]